MENFYQRTEMLLGTKSIEKLKNAHVLVLGLGGVGSYSVEALARAGVGKLTICDNDVVSQSNINRQLCALNSTIGQKKCDIIEKRLKDINPHINVRAVGEFYSEANRDILFNVTYDYIIDAIDSVPSKIDLICTATEKNIPIISSMGTGNKLNPSLFKITTMDKTSVCPLAKKMRYELRKRGITKNEVLFSTEIPVEKKIEGENVPGSVSWVPSSAGLMIAGHVLLKIANID